jgi:hypothetical protein
MVDMLTEVDNVLQAFAGTSWDYVFNFYSQFRMGLTEQARMILVSDGGSTASYILSKRPRSSHGRH